jgi:hypothetical protein
MALLPSILLTVVVVGHSWFIAAHARAWLLTRAWSPYGRPTLQALASFSAFIVTYRLLPPPLLLIIGTELTAGALGVYLTNTIRTPRSSVAPRDLLLLRAPRRPALHGTEAPQPQVAPIKFRSLVPSPSRGRGRDRG